MTKSATKSDLSKFHPALSVTNIRNSVPITLDLENGQYNSWSTLFKVNARAYDVLHHIIPPSSDKTTTSATSSPLSDADDPALWSRLDAIVLQWIYSTISNDLLHNILEHDDTAMAAWNRIRDLFHDNQAARAVHLEDEFTNTFLRQFPNATAYCQRLKMLADQLANVGVKLSDQRMVLKLIGGLAGSYKTFVTHITHTKPLPSFNEARSMLILEEATVAKHTVLEAADSSALVAQTGSNDSSPPRPSFQPLHHHNSGSPTHSGGRNTGSTRSRSNNTHWRNRHSTRGSPHTTGGKG